MQDKFEFGLKVLWDRDQIIREIEEEDEDIRRLKSEISSQKGSTYFARMQYGRLIDAALQARSERYVAEIFRALRDVSVASRSNKPIGDRMIMNAAFLVASATWSRRSTQRQGHRPALRQADVQVHRPVAALQLRQHPAEAGAGPLTCIILDTLLIGGLRFVLDKVAAAVDTELNDDTALREQLLAAQMRVELGEMTEEEFATLEADILARLREIHERRQGERAACRRPTTRSPASTRRSKATSTPDIEIGPSHRVCRWRNSLDSAPLRRGRS